MKHGARKKLKNNAKTKRRKKDEEAPLIAEDSADEIPGEELSVEDHDVERFQMLEDELFTISFMWDRAAQKSALLAFLVKYRIELHDWLPFKDGTLLDWALLQQYNLQFLDVVLELYKESGFKLNDFRYSETSLVQLLMDNTLPMQARLSVHYGASPDFYREGRKYGVHGSSFEEITAPLEKLRNAIHPGNVKQVVDEFVKDNKWDTPLDGENNCLLASAIISGVMISDLKYILSFYTDHIDCRNVGGKTPLMLAIEVNDLSAVKLLLKNKADVAALDNNGQSVSQYAMSSKRNDIFKLIFEKAPENHKTSGMHVRSTMMLGNTSKPLLFRKNGILRENSKVKREEFVAQNQGYGITSRPQVPMLDNKISEPHAQRWVQSHPRKLQNLAKKIVENIKHVDFTTFKNQLIACAQSLNLPNRYILVLPEEADKSNPWVLSLALPHLPHLPCKVLRPSEISDYVDNYRLTDIDFLFVDDAAFSGTQTKCLVDDVLSKVNATHKPRVHYLIPFMTKNAHKLLQRHVEAQFGDFKTIEGVSKLFTDEEKQVLQENNVNSTDPNVNYHLNWPELTLTYFQHKIADWKSAFPGIMREGRTINNINARLPFIPVTIEPYKSNPTLPYHTLQGLLSNHYAMGLPNLQNPALTHSVVPPPEPEATSGISSIFRSFWGW